MIDRTTVQESGLFCVNNVRVKVPKRVGTLARRLRSELALCAVRACRLLACCGHIRKADKELRDVVSHTAALLEPGEVDAACWRSAAALARRAEPHERALRRPDSVLDRHMDVVGEEVGVGALKGEERATHARQLARTIREVSLQTSGGAELKGASAERSLSFKFSTSAEGSNR